MAKCNSRNHLQETVTVSVTADSADELRTLMSLAGIQSDSIPDYIVTEPDTMSNAADHCACDDLGSQYTMPDTDTMPNAADHCACDHSDPEVPFAYDTDEDRLVDTIKKRLADYFKS